MKTPTILLLAGTLALAASTGFNAEAQEGLRRELKKGGGKCKDKNRAPADLQALLEASGSLVVEKEAAVKCTDEQITKIATWKTDGPNGPCGSRFNFKEQLGACCGGEINQNERSITVDTQFESPRFITGVKIDFDLTYKNQQCCKSCKCWGDPHCAQFGARVTLDREDRESKIKSFLACDNSVFREKGRCANRLDVDDAAKARCLGSAEGYEHNGEGRCRWRPDEDQERLEAGKSAFDPAIHGGPCVPSAKIGTLMFGHDIPSGFEVAAAEGEGSVAVKGRYDVFAYVGERGFTETVSIIIQKESGPNFETKTTESLTLSAKGECVYPVTADGSLMSPTNSQSAIRAEFSTDIFTLVRSVTIAGDSLDLNYEITDRITGDTVQFICRGAVDKKNRPAGFKSFQQLLQEQVAAETSANQVSVYSKFLDQYQDTEVAVTAGEGEAQSTTVDVATFVDSKFFVSVFPDGVTGEEGFCYDGKFDYEKNPAWFDTNGVTAKLETCQTSINLSLGDRDLIRALPDCQTLLQANGCENFVDEQFNAHLYGQQNKKWDKNFEQFRSILDKCIRVYCQKAFIPNAYSELECVTDFYDLGATTAMKTYVPDVRPDELNPSNIPYVQDVEACVPSVDVFYTYSTDKEGQNLETISKMWEEGDGPIFIDVEGMPQQLVIVQNDCAGICGTRPQIDLDVTFDSVCEELGEEYKCVKKGKNPKFDECVEECVVEE